MNRRLLILLAALLALPMTCLAASSVASAAASTPAPTLRVMTMNVRLPLASDGHNSWEHRRDVMADVVRQQHPDVFGTQELYKKQGDYLVQQLPQYAWFGEGRFGNDGDEHMGVFYRTDKLKRLKSGNFWLSDTPEVPGSKTWGQPFPRMVTWALFEVKATSRRFYFYNTHFPYRDQDTVARDKSAQELLARLKALNPAIPVVLTGDFNTSPDTSVHALLTSVLHDARLTAPKVSGPEKTFHNFTGTPDRRIDWILYRGFKPIEEHTVTTEEHGNYPSDHFPVVADLQWLPASKK